MPDSRKKLQSGQPTGSLRDPSKYLNSRLSGWRRSQAMKFAFVNGTVFFFILFCICCPHSTARAPAFACPQPSSWRFVFGDAVSFVLAAASSAANFALVSRDSVQRRSYSIPLRSREQQPFRNRFGMFKEIRFPAQCAEQHCRFDEGHIEMEMRFQVSRRERFRLRH